MFKEVISATVVTSESALDSALISEKSVIIIKGPLFDQALPEIKKAKQAKANKKIGGTAMALGFLAGGPIGWLALGVGGINVIAGKKRDPQLLKKYKIEIKEKERKIYLYKAHGENKYDTTKMTFKE